MSFDRIAVKKPEDLIPDDELEDSSLKGNKKYACDNFKDPTEIKCLDGRTRRHAETEEIFDDLFEDDGYDYHIKDSWNYLIRPAFLCEGIDPPKNMDNSGRCRGGIDDSCLEIIKEIHPENYEYSKQEIENFKQIQTSYYHPPSLLDTTRRKLFNRFYAGDSTDGYYFSDLIFSKPIREPINHIIRFWHKSTFENSIFLNYVYFGNSYSTGAINFSNTYFFDHVCMDNTILLGAKFENAIFLEPVRWTYSIFKNVIFKNTIFHKKVHFANDGKSFFSGTDFSNGTFHEEIYFNHCKFDNVSFEKNIFKKEAYFEGSDFKAKNNFNYCQFEGERETSFKKCTFIEKLECNYSIFKNDVRFEEATFKKGAALMKCIFEKTANFEKIKYSGIMNFSDTIFKDRLDFRVSVPLDEKIISTLNLTAIEAKTIFLSSSTIDVINIINSSVDSIFAQSINSQSAFIIGSTHIKHSLLLGITFFYKKDLDNPNETGIPDLRGIKLDGVLDINNINFDMVAKKVTKENALNSAQRWEALQHLCEKQGQYRKELEFFALAMDARQLAEEESPIKRWIAKRYKFFSDYGRSITRPFWWGIFIWFLFGLFYYLMVIKYENLNLNSISLEIDPFLKSFILSAKNTFPFLPDDVFARQYFQDYLYCHYKDNYSWYSFIRMLNVLSGLIFTFLTALGIRNWLRLR